MMKKKMLILKRLPGISIMSMLTICSMLEIIGLNYHTRIIVASQRISQQNN